MQRGKISRVTDRGFGFIELGEGQKDLFFHANELKNIHFNDIRVGDEVTFETEDSPKGPRAVNVNKA